MALIFILGFAAVKSAYHQLLDATINHLERLRSEGVKHVLVSPDALAALTQPQRPSKKAAIQHAPITKLAGQSQPLATGLVHQPQVAVSNAVDLGGRRQVPDSSSQVPALFPPAIVLSEAITDQEDPRRQAPTVESLRALAMACQRCPHLACARKNVVFGVGSLEADLMFVGEAPGADEDLQGEPFVGKAGQLLTRIIQTMGLSRERVYIANILKCRPDTPGQSAGNRKPTPEEMKTCLPFLLRQIDFIQPKVIVALGATAVEGLLGKTIGITRLRGHFQQFQGIPTMPTYHPAYLLRNQSMATKREVWEDMLQVMEKLGMAISERQRGFFLTPGK